MKTFVDFANSFHPTIKFTYELSSSKAVFLDTEDKRPRFSTLNSLDIRTHFNRPKLFNIPTSPPATLSTLKRVLSRKKHYTSYALIQSKRTSRILNETSNKDSTKEVIQSRLLKTFSVKFDLKTEKRLYGLNLNKEMRFYRLSQLIIRLYRILKRFS